MQLYKVIRGRRALTAFICAILLHAAPQEALSQILAAKDEVAQTRFGIKDDIKSYEILYKEYGSGYADYYHAVRERIVQRLKRNYGYHYRDGDVNLFFTLNSDGTLDRIDVDIDKSADDKGLIDVALLSIQQAAPFPAFPKELSVARLPFGLTISFKKE